MNSICIRKANALFLSAFSVVFRMVVFRPFSGEVILGKVKSSDEDGIRRMFSCGFYSSLLTYPHNLLLVSVGFFDDIYIPLSYLPTPTTLYVSVFISAYVSSLDKKLTHQRPKRASPLLARLLRATRRCPRRRPHKTRAPRLTHRSTHVYRLG
jgi:hypothetical protein